MQSLQPHPSHLMTLVLIGAHAQSVIDVEVLPRVLIFILEAIYEEVLTDSFAEYVSRFERSVPSRWKERLVPNVEELKTLVKFMAEGPDNINEFILRMRMMVEDREEEMAYQPLVDRASPFSIFARRCILDFDKLQFHERLALVDNIRHWIISTDAGGHPKTETEGEFAFDEQEIDGDFHSFGPGLMDPQEIQYVRERACNAYERALRTSDYNSALENLQRFFDHLTPPTPNLPINSQAPQPPQPQQHHYALTNLAMYHLQTGGLEAAADALDEAVDIAAQAGDVECIEMCQVLAFRLRFFSGAPAASQSRLTEDTLAGLPKYLKDRWAKEHAEMAKKAAEASGGDYEREIGEVANCMWNIRKGISDGEPIHNLFYHVYRSKALAHINPPTKIPPITPEGPKRGSKKRKLDNDADFDETAWHAIQAEMWRLQGVEEVADLHERLAIDASETETGQEIGWEARVSVLATRSDRLARQGRYDDALATLVEGALPVGGPSSTGGSGMTVSQCQEWQRAVYDVIRTKADRKGQDQIVDSLHSLNPLPSETDLVDRTLYDKREQANETSGGSENDRRPPLSALEEVRELLRKGRKMQVLNQSEYALGHIASAISLAESRGLHHLHRLALIMLADNQIDFDNAGRGMEILEEIWPQVLATQDIEQRAYARLTMARCIMSDSESSGQLEKVRTAIPYLQEAEKDYTTISNLPSILKVRKLHLSLSPSAISSSDIERLEQEHNKIRADMEGDAVKEIDILSEILESVSVRCALGE